MTERNKTRAKMPATAAFLDDLAKVIGEEAVWQQVEKAFAGEPTFWARENGVRVGTRDTVHTSVIFWDEQGVARSRPADWIIEARAYAKRTGANIREADPANEQDVQREAAELRALIQAANNKGKAV